MLSLITWGKPAQIVSSKENFYCDRCGAARGLYGRDFGIGPDGNPVSLVEDYAFDVSISETEIAAVCWRCKFSFQQNLPPPITLRKKKNHEFIRHAKTRVQTT